MFCCLPHIHRQKCFIRSIRFVGAIPTSHINLIVILALEIFRRLTSTYPLRHPMELPHAHGQRRCPRVFNVLTRSLKTKRKMLTSRHGKQVLGGFLFSQNQTAKASADQNRTGKSRHRKQFFGGFFVFTKANGKSLSRTKQNVQKQTQKASRTR